VAPVDFTGMVNRVISELTTFTAKGRLAIDVQPLLPARADGSMMEQVWLNLIGNALKYSSKRERIRIAVGSYQQNGENLYFVKDNGAGFNMQYADKLFHVFQRLHKQEEFPGTGVGLALVKRIISRHGGRIWAESVVDEGATFHFSLPNK